VDQSSSKSGRVDASATRFWQKINLVAEISTLCRRQRPECPSYEAVLELIQRIIPFDAATLFTADPLTGRLEIQACLGEEVALPGFLSFQVDPSAGNDSFPRKPVVYNAESCPVDFDSDAPYEATMIVPLLIEGAIIGVLNLGSYSSGVLVERHLKLMSIVADQLAVSIERLSRMAEIQSHHRELEQAHRQLRENQRQIIDAEKLAAAVSLAASINHEINNPLSVIVGQVQCLMVEDHDFDARTIERLQRVEQAAIRIGEINRRLLKIDSVVETPV
jgi:signal transduction histidine kinase